MVLLPTFYILQRFRLVDDESVSVDMFHILYIDNTIFVRQKYFHNNIIIMLNLNHPKIRHRLVSTTFFAT